MRSAAPATRLGNRVSQRWEYLALSILVFFHVVNNWVYLKTRVTILWWDWPSHLNRTLMYDEILRQINLRTLFEAMTRTWYRPPLPWLPSVPLTRVLGQSDDVAIMGNSVFMVILILSVYGIGKKAHSRRAGLLAAFLVSTTPILFNLSRLPYPDYALTAMVACAINWLLRVDGFRHRGYSLLFGLSLGLGMLTKQPFIIFVGPPIAYVFLKSGAVRGIRTRLTAQRNPDAPLAYLRGSPLVAVLVALAITLVWYIPNKEYVTRFYLGHKLVLCYWVLLSATFYILSRRPSPVTNFLSAVALGITIASVWYLPNILSFRRVLVAGYSGITISEEPVTFLEPRAYIRYSRLMFEQQLGPLYSAALAFVVPYLAYQWLGRARGSSPKGWLSDDVWIVTLWSVVSYSFYTLSLTDNVRMTVPLLPAAAVIISVGLCRIRRRVVRLGLVSLVAVIGIVQFSALSFDGLAEVRKLAMVRVPVIGEVNAFAHGSYILLPNSGPTDSGYFVLPDLLCSVKADLLQQGKTEAEVALLVDAPYLNAVTFDYLSQAAGYDGVKLISLSETRDDPPLYNRVFASDYVVVWDTSAASKTERAQLSLALLRESPSFFRERFHLLAEYPVPDGDRILLYASRGQLSKPQDWEVYAALGDTLQGLSQPEDAIILDAYEQVGLLGPYYTGQAWPYWFSGDEPLNELQIEGRLEEMASKHRRIFAVFSPQEDGGIASVIERWLNQHQYRALHEWYDGTRLIVYETSKREGRLGISRSFGVTLGRSISLLGWHLADGEAKPGDVVRLTLRWRGIAEMDQSNRVFVHLLDLQNELVAQHDGEPVGGSRPTTSWSPGEIIVDKHGVLLPQDIPEGAYRLVAGMYSPVTGRRLAMSDSEGQGVGDHILLGVVEIEP